MKISLSNREAGVSRFVSDSHAAFLGKTSYTDKIRSMKQSTSAACAKESFIWHWLHGIRLYIGIASLLISVEAWYWSYTLFHGGILYQTRLEEVYGWLGLLLIILALAIGPLYAVFRHLPAKGHVFDSRRAIGISAAWFAVLHSVIAYFGLFDHQNPFYLPQQYKVAFLAGGLAAICLLLMAITSVDAAMRYMKIWWFRLHRTIYLVVILVLFHAYSIGVHAVSVPLLIVVGLLATVVLGLHVYRYFIQRQPTRWQLIAVCGMTILLILVIGYGVARHLGKNPVGGFSGLSR